MKNTPTSIHLLAKRGIQPRVKLSLFLSPHFSLAFSQLFYPVFFVPIQRRVVSFPQFLGEFADFFFSFFFLSISRESLLGSVGRLSGKSGDWDPNVFDELMTILGMCRPFRDPWDRVSERCFRCFPCLSDPGTFSRCDSNFLFVFQPYVWCLGKREEMRENVFESQMRGKVVLGSVENMGFQRI